MEKDPRSFFIFRKLEPLTPLSLLKLMKESKIPGEDSLTFLIRSLTSVSTAKNSKQLYLLFSHSQTFQGAHHSKNSKIEHLRLSDKWSSHSSSTFFCNC
jgi:hypothetical protein